MSDRLFVPLNKEWYNLFLAEKRSGKYGDTVRGLMKKLLK